MNLKLILPIFFYGCAHFTAAPKLIENQIHINDAITINWVCEDFEELPFELDSEDLTKETSLLKNALEPCYLKYCSKIDNFCSYSGNEEKLGQYLKNINKLKKNNSWKVFYYGLNNLPDIHIHSFCKNLPYQSGGVSLKTEKEIVTVLDHCVILECNKSSRDCVKFGNSLLSKEFVEHYEKFNSIEPFILQRIL